MSVAVDLVREAGPYVLGLAGIYATYRSGVRHGREARHHARVEKLYIEMLESLDDQLDSIVGVAPAGDAQAPHKLTPQIWLYAPRNVQVVWEEALGETKRAVRTWAMAKERGEQPSKREMMEAYNRSKWLLARAMSADLGVPTHNARAFRAIYSRVRRLRRDATHQVSGGGAP
jgi:hypothetical protein